jgi:hypothetical protein
MAVMDSILEEELERLETLKKQYMAKIAKMPQGSISIKIKRGGKYVYLAYRDGKNIRTDYIGRLGSPKANEITNRIEQRRKMTSELKAINNDIKQLRKMLNVR